MAPVQDLLPMTPVRRSPSPVLPGAWPLTVNIPNSAHKRSNTCPALSGILPKPSNNSVSSAYPNSLHLEHVRDFHQRLSLSLSRPPDPSDICNTMSRSLDLTSNDPCPNVLGSLPSTGSDLTRWTPNDTSTSFSALADTSLDTADTTHSASWGSLPSRLPQMRSKPRQYGPNIHDHLFTSSVCPDLYASDSRLGTLASEDIPNLLNKGQVLSPLSTSTCFKSQAHVTAVLPQTSHSDARPFRILANAVSPSPTASSMSPILFSSPMFCDNASPAPAYKPNGSMSFEISSSPYWETSNGSGSNDDDISQVAIFPPALRLHSVNAFNPTRHDRTPSLDMDPQTIPMLTALSLPGSVDSSFGCLANPNIRDMVQTGEGTTWALSSSPTSPPFSETLPRKSPTSHSLSPNSAVLGDRDEMRVLEFPSPSVSLSPFTSPFPSPIVEPPTPENTVTSQTDAAEYAVALMSSVWGEQEDQIAALPSAEYGIPGINVQRIADDVTHLGSEEETHTTGLMIILKRFGAKIKKFLQRKPRGTRTEIDVDVTRPRAPTHAYRPLVSISDIQSPSTACFANSQSDPESIRIGQDTQGRFSLRAPPGLLSRPGSTPPGLIAQPYGCPPPERFADVIDSGSASPPVIRNPPMESYSDGDPQISQSMAKELGTEACPKTLKAIKSSRRFSLSTISQFSRSSSPTNFAIAAMARPRSRPVSTVIFRARPQDHLVEENSSQNMGASLSMAATADRECIQVASSLSDIIVQPSDTTTSTSEVHRPGSAVLVKKKKHRISLSALNLS